MEPLYEIPKCKRFTGYKPCFPEHNCWEHGCKDCIPIGTKILIINLDAMGDVLMTTAQLPGIKRKFPESTIFWITLKNAEALLQNNPYIDKVFRYDFDSVSILQQIEFDYVYNVDKSLNACALTNSLKAKNKLGFGLNPDGKIYPLNEGALYNYRLGMDNHLKFKVNQRTGEDYLAETLELEYRNDEYTFCFTEAEKEFTENYKNEVGITNEDFVVGFNTGCSNLYPNKKLTVEQHIAIIEKLLALNLFKIILLGGPEDIERNALIYSKFEGKIINTPANLGLRKGACFENIADVVITGDSFGMHMAIALKKYVIAWFGLSCWTEIELFNRGIKIYPENLECSPCWKKECPLNLECRNNIDLDRIVNEVVNYHQLKSGIKK